MEEKERYKWRYSSKVLNQYIFDNRDCKQLGYEEIIALLNQQDKRIKELELQERFNFRDICYLEEYQRWAGKAIIKLLEKKLQLEQSQKQLAVIELKKILNLFDSYENEEKETIVSTILEVSVFDYLENRIKELEKKE